ncbi:MAG: VOC family protein [Thomasclavelia sp.]|nr:VOC family protein [Thomasclavelia sp.]
MKFTEVMHLSFYTDNMAAMRDFYENKLGLKAKIIMRYEAYKGQTNRGAWADRAETNPKDIAYIFIELAPGQYLELFPKADHQNEHDIPDSHLGYSHFALMVEDIQEAHNELVRAGVSIDI